ncbi:MAG: hypothetical protein HC880_05795 [Bacteroidia bacterium]|nr:hypothetical protein [Bacteroidia bacterium]
MNKYLVFVLILFFIFTQPVFAQFLADFEETTPDFQENGLPGWGTFTGDGNILFSQKIHDGVATLRVNAVPDSSNIWYAFFHRDMRAHLNVESLRHPNRELRIEARVRPSHAPRRVNLYLTQPNGSSYLREFDLPIAREWHTISMTTKDFEVNNQEHLFGQLSLMDWGKGEMFELDVDYLKVEVVDTEKSPPDSELQVRYRPPQAPTESFAYTLSTKQTGVLDTQYPHLNLSQWRAFEGDTEIPVLTLDNTKIILLQWDFTAFFGKKVYGEAQLALYTHHIQRLAESPKDFGEIRICEVLEAPIWTAETVTYQSFFGNSAPRYLINPQTIIDTKVNSQPGEATVVTISRPVMQRLLDGQTKGLAIVPLGLIQASFYATQTHKAPLLRLNFE